MLANAVAQSALASAAGLGRYGEVYIATHCRPTDILKADAQRLGERRAAMAVVAAAALTARAFDLEFGVTISGTSYGAHGRIA